MCICHTDGHFKLTLQKWFMNDYDYDPLTIIINMKMILTNLLCQNCSLTEPHKL